ncbi:MAG: DNA repair protein RecN, partial [Eubacteriales bacterium]|nr:DNA repair protein RecN [Eubacteriales bacterium]
DARATKLEKEIEKTRLELLSDAEELSALRRKYALSFEDEINKQLKELGMPSAKFNVSFDENDGKTADDVTSNGFDKVEFLISANKGEPLKPLQKIISGGEMSRFMLLLKTSRRVLTASTLWFLTKSTPVSADTSRRSLPKSCTT